jgi:prophage regulatory protein
MATATQSVIKRKSKIENLSHNEKVLRFPELKEKIGLSRSHVHALISRKKFPAPIKLGDRASGWLESDINEWLQKRIIESQPADDHVA